ncbi:TetR/AcrR family transcriptional regulator [Edaphobacter aggregans]|uniref:TetR/AcrR family transcriptional regulator n=1 Tax=Edaphobacter aggregans TaxID=570835 RepID=UPI00054EE306|nr:TetR/AcrR family transcriptional regulator [Edaphobacter aggregans]
MPRRSKPQLEPRKSPVQARSNASVEAICEATIQVLLSVGQQRLTTTKVAARAGVSVGTLYQYFPNKSSLLQAVVRRHMEKITRAVEAACAQQRGAALEQMADVLVAEYLAAKLRDVEASKAIYYVSDDVGGAEIVRHLTPRGMKAISEMLESSGASFTEDVHVIAATALAAMYGVSRTMLEASKAPGTLEAMREGLQVMVRAYVNACAVASRASSARAGASER